MRKNWHYMRAGFIQAWISVEGRVRRVDTFRRVLSGIRARDMDPVIDGHSDLA